MNKRHEKTGESLGHCRPACGCKSLLYVCTWGGRKFVGMNTTLLVMHLSSNLVASNPSWTQAARVPRFCWSGAPLHRLPLVVEAAIRSEPVELATDNAARHCGPVPKRWMGQAPSHSVTTHSVSRTTTSSCHQASTMKAMPAASASKHATKARTR